MSSRTYFTPIVIFSLFTGKYTCSCLTGHFVALQDIFYILISFHIETLTQMFVLQKVIISKNVFSNIEGSRLFLNIFCSELYSNMSCMHSLIFSKMLILGMNKCISNIFEKLIIIFKLMFE